MHILFFMWTIIYSFNVVSEPSYVLNVISYFLWILTIVVLFKKDVQLSVLIFFVSFSYVTTGLSCIFAETGSFYRESGWDSYLTGAVSKNLSLCFFLYYFIYITYQYTKNIFPKEYPVIPVLNKCIKFFCVFFSCVIILSLFMIFIKYGSPNDYNVDRFYYWENIAPAWGDYLKFNFVQMCFILGLIYSKSNNKLILAILTAGIIAQVCVGEKFTGIFSSLIFFFTPYFVVENKRIKILSVKSLFCLSIILGVFLLIIISSYSSIVGGSEAYESLLSRVILQSQMWWAVDHVSTNNIHSMKELISSFFGMAREDDKIGIFYLMTKITTPYVFNWYYEQKINFTMASPVNFIYFFGYTLSPLFIAPLGVYCGLMYSIMRRAILRCDYFILLVFIKILYSIVRILTMGEMQAFTDVKFIFLNFIVIIYMSFMCLSLRNRKHEIEI